MPKFPRIYLAGPDVFLPDSAAIFGRLKSLCASFGMTGVAPTDGNFTDGFSGSDDALARCIYEGNIQHIRGADGVIANLQSFRGHEPDSGTVFEVGYATALGKPVVGYGVPASTYAERVSASVPCSVDDKGVTREIEGGVMVEGLGQRINLMLARSTPIESTAEAALARLAGMLRTAGS